MAKVSRNQVSSMTKQDGGAATQDVTDALGRELDDDEREFIENTSPYKFDKETLVDDMHELAEEVGEPVSKSDMDEHGRHGTQTYQLRFGSWREAVEYCGYESYMPDRPDYR